jgi:putative protease
MKQFKPELLAPAGNMESLYAAIAAGCDAVYLGGKKFGARAFSNNFTDEEMISAIKYAHLYGVKVYVTCNTLIYDEEVPAFIKYIDFLHRNNVDAVLIQDIGMLDLVRKTYPNLAIHASTQMHIHNLDGVEFLTKLGVKRVVLARETPIEIVKEIKAKTNMPIEIFIHGALCISYSGECLMSYLNGGRSGNRGECAGCCRMPYDVISGNQVLNKENKFPLSAKDLNTLTNFGELIEAGVDSLKIEGRMKSPSYVYLVVSLYREAIDSYLKDGKVKIDEAKLHDLMIIFNREYTKGFLFHENNNDFVNMAHSNHQGLKIGEVINYNKHFATIKLSDYLYIGDGLRVVGETITGVKVNEFFLNRQLIKMAKPNDIISLEVHQSVNVGDSVLKTSSEHIDNLLKFQSNRKVSVTASVIAKINEPLTIKLTDGINNVSLSGFSLTAAINQPTTEETILDKLHKTGNTVYEIVTTKIDMDDNVFIPLKIFNDLRRDAFIKLDELRIGEANYLKKDYYLDVPDFKKTNLKTCLVGSQKILDTIAKENYHLIYADEKIAGTIYRLPRIMTSYLPVKHTLITELGALNKVIDSDTDATLNVVNSYAVGFLHSQGVGKITLAYEMTYDNVRNLIRTYEARYKKHPNVEVVTKGLIEAMILRFNLNEYYQNDHLKLVDSFKNVYPLTTKNNYQIIYSSKSLNLYDDYYAIGVNAIRTNYFN